MTVLETTIDELKEIVLGDYNDTTFRVRGQEVVQVTAADSTIAHQVYNRLKEYGEVYYYEERENDYFQIELTIIF